MAMGMDEGRGKEMGLLIHSYISIFKMQDIIASVFWRIEEEAGGFLAPRCLTLPDWNGSFSSSISLHSLGQVQENYSLSAIKEDRTLCW